MRSGCDDAPTLLSGEFGWYRVLRSLAPSFVPFFDGAIFFAVLSGHGAGNVIKDSERKKSER